MNIWIFVLGEPIESDSANIRLHRSGMLTKYLVAAGHKVTFWTSNVNHVEKKLSTSTFNFSARLEVDYINQKYGLCLPETEFYETIGGLVAYNTGEIPKKGEQIEIPPYTLTIKKVSATKIEEVIITEINEI